MPSAASVGGAMAPVPALEPCASYLPGNSSVGPSVCVLGQWCAPASVGWDGFTVVQGVALMR